LKILSRTTAPTTGSVKVKGRIASLLEVGTGFHGELSGRENIYLNGAIMGLRKWEIDKKLDEIIDFAGVEKYLDTPVKRYSSGMYVRLAFAVAAYLEPDILIVDEVLAVGDAEFQKKCLGKMKDVSEGQGRTVLFVSHNMASIESLCNFGVLIKSGKLLIKDDISSVINKYLFEGQNIVSDLKEIQSESCKIRFEAVNFFCNGVKSNLLLTGTEVKIEFELLSDDDYKNINLAIGFFTLKEQRKLILFSEFSNSFFDVKKGTTVVSVKVKKFPLSSGMLKYNLLINNGSQKINWIQNAGEIQVENGDFFGTGRTIELTDIICHVEQSWKVIR
jgi:lipopolysaccharide transport system ATP-binding protein